MHTRWFLVALALIGAALACIWDPFSSSIPKISYVDSVAVTPASGSGSFTLEVGTSVSPFSSGSYVEPISCYYVTPGGATMAIGSVMPPIEGGPRTDTLTFNVSEPGDYTATCENSNSLSKKSAQFTVSDYPRIIKAVGVVTLEVASPATKCVAQSQVSLTILADGAAQLLFTAPHRQPGQCPTETDTWFANGRADFAQQTVAFTSGSGTEKASGVVSYKDGVLKGTVEYLAGAFKYKIVLGKTP